MQTSPGRRSNLPWLIAGGAVLLACLCICAVAVSGLTIFRLTRFGPATQVVLDDPDRPNDGPATATGSPAESTEVAEQMQTPVPTPAPGESTTFDTLRNEDIPPADLRELAMRLQGVPDIPVTVSDTPANHQVGDVIEFNVLNEDTREHFTVDAELIYASENVYFFSEVGVGVDEDGVRELVDDFQANAYPTNREFFGSEWNPGVDGDPRLYILYARGLGFSIAGYYSSSDEYSTLAQEYSNEKEMFYISADNTFPGSDESLPGTLAHEFQHMIHWYHDRNEETWMNEGSSVMAELLNGFGADGFDSVFISDPDLQLNTWSDGSPGADSIPHYGAAFLFMTYFLDRFGEEVTQALVNEPDNGLFAVDKVLAQEALTDAATGAPITAVDLFADWVVANYLGDPDAGDGRYFYHDYEDAPTVGFPTGYLDCPATEQARVHQFAADYFELGCTGEVTLAFEGARSVQVIPADVHSGRYAWWSHRNDESDTTLTRAFDLTGVAEATLNYWTWYAIEEEWDFVYLEVSTDGGQTWTIVETPSGTDADPVGNNLGWGYTGNSGGRNQPEWIQESVDLSDYAGQEILVRFEYVTDAAVNWAGFLLDDLEVPEIGYATDFESGDDDWDGAGFVRMDNLLPQQYVVQVIVDGDETRVERFELDENNAGSLTLDLARGDTATVVVSGATLFTTETASYSLSVR